MEKKKRKGTGVISSLKDDTMNASIGIVACGHEHSTGKPQLSCL